jgi:hypothetical protein
MRCIEPLIKLDRALPFTIDSQINQTCKINEVRVIKWFDCFWGLEINLIELENLGFLVVAEKLPSAFIQF